MVRRTFPVRTCVGCRVRVQTSELLRVVAVPRGAEDPDRSTGPELFSVEPDPTRTRPGRGASLHPDPACLALAERRRAFGRALRLPGVVDTGPLAGYVRNVAARPDSGRAVLGSPLAGRRYGPPGPQG